MNYKYYQISKKCSYAIRAMFELALRNAAEPITVRKLADAQDIPVRFLEIILNELKQGGFVVSVRGKSGGYLPGRKAKDISIAEIIRFFEKPAPMTDLPDYKEIHPGDFVIGDIMCKINQHIEETWEGITLQDMLDREQKNKNAFTSNYII